MHRRTDEQSSPLLGRDREQSLLTAALDDVAERGQARVVRGEPGIGKSRLLYAAASAARERGCSILTVTGVQSEASLPFAGLHQLLRPVRQRAGALPEFQQAALDAAFGLAAGNAPEHFQVAMATLDLICDLAAEGPVLVLAEDAHWLDPPTAEVLAFIARRIESDPIVLLASVRDGYASVLDDAGLPELRLTALDPDAAALLLDDTAPDLTPELREVVLREAAGNPLAILELPTAVAARGVGELADGLPLTERLERAFAAQVGDLPAQTRQFLLVAALDDGDRVEEILSASSILATMPVGVDAATPAVQARVISLDLDAVRFRHPLIRSAVAQRASPADRRRVHDALAEVLSENPDRRAWHRAAGLQGPHEDVALELEASANRARQRGAAVVAVTAMTRAAELSEPGSRARRLVDAARLAVEVGRPQTLRPLLDELQQLEHELEQLQRIRVMWVEEMVLTRALGDGARLQALIRASHEAGTAGDRELQIDLLWLVASRAWWVDPGAEARSDLITEAQALGGADAEDPRVVAIHAYADPLGHAAGVLSRLRRTAAESPPDVDSARLFGPTALVVGAFDLGSEFLAHAIDGLRREGRVGHLPRLLTLYANMTARTGNWDLAVPAADEARRLAEEFADPHWMAAADSALSLVAAMRGDDEQAERLAASAELVAERLGANVTVAFAQFGRVLAALAIGRHADAYAAAERTFDPTDSAYHPVVSSWLIADLAEAARHLDRLEAARARVSQVEAMVGERPGTWIALALQHARALLAEPDEAIQRFASLLTDELNRWPFERARVQLAYGQLLRRQRRVADSREILRSARDTFDALDCTTWGERARRELRASGERSRRHVAEVRDQLTPQELQIAQLAADGLSNREIGQRLYLSHRTVSTHLYRVFPKLGISSRADLGDALSRATRESDLVAPEASD